MSPSAAPSRPSAQRSGSHADGGSEPRRAGKRSIGPNAATTPRRARFDADRAEAILGSTAPAHGHAYFEQLRGRLRWRLLIAYVLPLLLLLGYFHWEYESALEEGTRQHLASVADNQRNTVELFLQERVANLRQAFDHQRLQTPSTTSSVLAELLVELRAKSDAFVDLGLFDPEGTLVAYAGPHPSLLGRCYRSEHWLQEVLRREDGTYLSDVYLGFRREPHFIIAQARQVAGKPWILRASVDPREFAAFVGRSHLVEPAEAFIINLDGQRQTLSAGEQLGKVFPLPTPPPGQTVVADRVLEGQPSLSAVAPLTIADWALVVTAPKRGAIPQLSRQRALIGVGLVLALVLVIGLALRSTSKLVSRLEQADTDREDLTHHLFNAAKLASIGEMAAGVAHEINNPLAIIYETAGVMKDTLDPAFGVQVDHDEFVEQLKEIEGAALRGRGITRQLLAFARKHQPERELLDVNVEIQRALAIKDNEFRVSNIEVLQRFDPELPMVIADANQLEQVLLNLLNNARDAIGEDGRVTVSTSEQQGFACIEIEDSGCGMTHEQMEKVFFPFFTTKEVGQGTGLGLSISYGIIKAQGGRIEVESEVGEGTLFAVYLPGDVPPPSSSQGAPHAGGRRVQ